MYNGVVNSYTYRSVQCVLQNIIWTNVQTYLRIATLPEEEQ